MSPFQPESRRHQTNPANRILHIAENRTPRAIIGRRQSRKMIRHSVIMRLRNRRCVFDDCFLECGGATPISKTDGLSFGRVCRRNADRGGFLLRLRADRVSSAIQMIIMNFDLMTITLKDIFI